MFVLILFSFLPHHSSSPHTTILILPPFSSCIFLLLWSRFAYKMIHKYIRERTSIFASLCSGNQILEIFTEVPLFAFSPPASSIILTTFFYMTTQEPSLHWWLSFRPLASATSASFSRLRMLRIYRPNSPRIRRASYFLFYRPRQILHWIPACLSSSDTAWILFWRRKLHTDAHITWQSAERRYHLLVC